MSVAIQKKYAGKVADAAWQLLAGLDHKTDTINAETFQALWLSIRIYHTTITRCWG
jgi:hypothetical protein